MKTSAKQSAEFVGHSLYHFGSCPFCLKVRFHMWRKGIHLALRDIHKQTQHARDLEEGGGKIQVPCLRIENATGTSRWLYESTDIITYLTSAQTKHSADRA